LLKTTEGFFGFINYQEKYIVTFSTKHHKTVNTKKTLDKIKSLFYVGTIPLEAGRPYQLTAPCTNRLYNFLYTQKKKDP